MPLRIITGTVMAGHENDFVVICRQQVADRNRLEGLGAFIAGYRRVDGLDRFVLAATWDTDEDASRVAGNAGNLTAAKVLTGVATVDSFDVYDVLEPRFRGIVDAPGGVVRVSRSRVPAQSHDAMLTFLRKPPRDRSLHMDRLLLGWMVGERSASDGGGSEVVAISAWPTPLVIEAVADSDRPGAPLFSDIDSFATDFQTDQYRAIELQLPEENPELAAGRVIAARFGTVEAAQEAAQALSAAIGVPRDPNIAVAPLGVPGRASDVRSFILVARLTIKDFARAERLIADQGGEVILSQVAS
jgi:hypothetical protein